MTDRTSRRSALKLVGGLASTVFVAGCSSDSGNGDDNGDDNGDGNGSGGEASFEVSDLDPGETSVTRGDAIDVSATVTNSGNEAGEQDVELQVDGDVLGSQTVSLDPDGEETVSFESVDTSDLEPGEYTHGVHSDDDEATGTLTISEPEAPFFEVSGLDPEETSIQDGDPIDVSATVTNSGNEAGEQDVELRIDGDALGSQTVSLDPGGEETVSFEGVDTSDYSPGEYVHSVYSEDSGATGSLTIEQPLEPADWEDVDSIRLLGNGSGWIGAEPEMIDGLTNPSILLFEGQEYDLTWENDDGAPHNLEILDADRQVVNGYSTEIASGTDVVQTLTVEEATSEMVRYQCNPHAAQMNGDIVIE